MNDQEMQIAIAEACGWTNCIPPNADEYLLLTEREMGLAMGRPVGRNLPLYLDGLHYPLPDYLNDLNAMHEAEKVLLADVNMLAPYKKHLAFATCVAGEPIYHATAAQRAEAFLKTLNLWNP